MAVEALADADRVIKELKEDYIAKVYFPIDRDRLELVAQSFLDFLALPQSFKDNEDLHFLLNNRPSADVGYMNRIKGEVGARDNKQFFHYHPEAEIRFKHLFGQEKAFDHLIEESRIVYDYCLSTAAREILKIDSCFPGVYDQFFNVDKRPNFFLRLLGYYPTNEGDFLAEDHNDLAAFSLAFYQSHDGLQTDSPEGMRPVEIGRYQSLFFKGCQPVIGLPEELSVPEYHGVLQKGSSLIRPDVARVSMVCFGDVLDPITIPRESITTRFKHLN